LFFQRRLFTIKMQEGEDLLMHINMVKAFTNNYVPLKWRLKMKMCTWYFSWAFPHLLITWSQVWNPCPLRMSTFNSSSFDYFMRFLKK
jgi:hypothetical protein